MSEAEGKKEAKRLYYKQTVVGEQNAYKKCFQIKCEENSGQELKNKEMGSKTGIHRRVETIDDTAILYHNIGCGKTYYFAGADFKISPSACP